MAVSLSCRCGALHISIGSLAIFLAWINLLLFLRKIPRLGIYFVMFTDVLKTFSLFSVTFSLFIIAFALGFYILLNTQVFIAFCLWLFYFIIVDVGETLIY